MLEPFWKCFPGVAPYDVNGASTGGIRQAHEGEVEMQRADQYVGQACRYGSRFSPNPRRRYRRKSDKIP